MKQRRRRSLTEAELKLWEAVARTAAPLRPVKPPKPVKARKAAPVAAARTPIAEPPPPKRRAPTGPEILDRRTVSRLARGSIGIDDRLDLHGLTQEEAHQRLQYFLSKVQATGGRVVLVITGKGGPVPSERGVLRHQVPHWLASPRFRPLVSGFDQAHRAHGGSGALYVRLKRARTGS